MGLEIPADELAILLAHPLPWPASHPHARNLFDLRHLSVESAIYGWSQFQVELLYTVLIWSAENYLALQPCSKEGIIATLN